ncbi:hypothetical protein HK105_202898 [Polyrhizophydium stewartii]|uniref:Glycosyltransferase 2-like domain-containing protein n=1 Tax=Polyrhizophydium stewartii TaxID=2732419 RepID=A0ABR4NDL4_9FUNG|nr:hypothetical protein HK105_002924 [Polyrhizophydium stewartii]
MIPTTNQHAALHHARRMGRYDDLAGAPETWGEHIRAAILEFPWKPILQRVPGLCIIGLVFFAIFGPAYTPWLFAVYFILLHAMFVANNLRTIYGTFVAYTHSKAHSMTDWYAKYCRETGAIDGSDTTHDLPFDQIMHIIIIPNYKETMDTICETLDVLGSHRRAMTQYKICLAMEEAEKGSSEKAQELLKLYGDHFFEITYTIHPTGRPGEIRGKSSNVAWAARQMAMRGGPRHDHEIVTVMDCDTGFAEDYFSAASYHYAVASPEQRRIMMFAPTTVFDRNAKNVPSFVRITDMYWSIGVMSNLYPSSPVKIPCSAYSVSMELAISVGFWDTDPGSIGEDMHMYLKCFFSTGGRVIVKTIYSPASQCNIEGEGTGIVGYINGFAARYTQGKRHLWGTLDFGYSVRRSIFAFVSPETENAVYLKNAGVTKYGKEDAPASAINLPLMLTLAHRMFETHLLMGQFLSLVIFSAVFVPSGNSVFLPLSEFIWSFVSQMPVPSVVIFALNVGFWTRAVCVPLNVFAWYYYEKYHQWVGFDRWNLQDRSEGMPGRRVDSAADLSYIPEGVLPGYDQPKVQYLGLRPQLASPRIYPWALFDWIATPLSGVFFFVGPQYHAQLSHLFTDRLDYKVAAKPTLNRPAGPPPPYSETSVPVAFNDVLVETSAAHPSIAANPASLAAASHTQPQPYDETRIHMASSAAASASASPVGMHALMSPATPASSNTNMLVPSHLKSGASAASHLLHLHPHAHAHAHHHRLDELEVKSLASSRGDEGYFDETDDASTASLTPSSRPVSAIFV